MINYHPFFSFSDNIWTDRHNTEYIIFEVHCQKLKQFANRTYRNQFADKILIIHYFAQIPHLIAVGVYAVDGVFVLYGVCVVVGLCASIRHYDDIGLHHSPIFSIFDLSLSGTSGKQTLQIQEYSYSAKNIEALQQELNAELIEVYKSLDFESFFQLFKDEINHCCKLAKPKYSKRHPINNPWITDGIIDAIEHKNDLYIDWIRTKI